MQWVDHKNGLAFANGSSELKVMPMESLKAFKALERNGYLFEVLCLRCFLKPYERKGEVYQI